MKDNDNISLGREYLGAFKIIKGLSVVISHNLISFWHEISARL